MSKRKKIGIVTISENVPNYGQRLQCFMVQQILSELGFDSEMIQDARWYKNPLLFKTNWKDILHSILHYHLIPEKHGFRTMMYLWIKRNIKTSPFSIMKDEDMDVLPMMYDGFVTGSDQVWNPYYDTRGLNSFTTLQFVPKEKRIAYSASIASYDIPQNRVQEFKSYLKDFGPISMREKSGANIIHALLGREVPVTIDPTLMWSGEQWARKFMRTPKINKKYLALFLYGQLKKTYESQALSIALEKKIEVLNLNKLPRVSDYSVESWFGYLKNAEYVVTNSFHCCIFSLLFHKNITIFRNLEIEKLMGSRIMDLLELLNVPYKSESLGEEIVTTTCINEKDWNKIEMKLAEERLKAWNYLKKAFADI